MQYATITVTGKLAINDAHIQPGIATETYVMEQIAALLKQEFITKLFPDNPPKKTQIKVSISIENQPNPYTITTP